MSDNPNVSQSDLQQAFESYHQMILPYLGGGGYGGSAHKYSTEEQVVGTWIDGRPVYERVVVVTSNFTSNTIISLNGEGDICVHLEGCALRKDSSVYSTTIMFYNTSSDYAFPYGGISEGNIYLRLMVPSSMLSSLQTVYYQIQYTKTTDTPTV